MRNKKKKTFESNGNTFNLYEERKEKGKKPPTCNSEKKQQQKKDRK